MKGERMNSRRWRGLLPLVTSAALVLVAGCSGIGNAASPPSVEKPTLTVGVVPAVDSAGFFIALYQNLFKEQGLNVSFVPVTSSRTAIANQVKGIYDITGGNYVSYIQPQQEGQANLDIFAEGSLMEPGAQAIYTMPGSPIKTLANLEGKTIGINAPDNILYLLVASVLADHGIPVSKVKFKDIPFPGRARGAKAGRRQRGGAARAVRERRGGDRRRRAARRPEPGRDHELSRPGLRGDQAVGAEVPEDACRVLQGARGGPGRRGHQPH